MERKNSSSEIEEEIEKNQSSEFILVECEYISNRFLAIDQVALIEPTYHNHR